jgi:predicted RNA binding protein YcfA (HicA-like mRNA interferase family)
MPALPVLSGAEVVRILQTKGWSIKRRRGSHVVLTKPGSATTLSVPDHKEVARGTLRSLIQAADLTVDEFFSP